MVQKGRITIDPHKMGGVPCIRDVRMPVATLLAMLADGMTEDQTLGEYPEIEIEDIQESLKYASEFFRLREFPQSISGC